MMTLFYVLSAITYIIIGFTIVVMDGLTEGRLWPNWWPVAILFGWPFFVGFEFLKGLAFWFKK